MQNIEKEGWTGELLRSSSNSIHHTGRMRHAAYLKKFDELIRKSDVIG